MSAADIRNVTFLGSSDSGKTSLVEALAHHFGVTNRLGQVADGTTVCDFTPEEKDKKHSLSAAVVHLKTKAGHANLIDTPGYPDYLADAVTSMQASGVAVFTLAANNDGVPFHTRRLWKMAGQQKMARAVVVTKADGDNLELDRILETVRSLLGNGVVPVVLPDQLGAGFQEVQPVLGGDSEWRSALVDAVVEADDDLMEKYLEGEELSDDEIRSNMHLAMSKGTFQPLFFIQPMKGVGIERFASYIGEYFPSASEMATAMEPDGVEDGAADSKLHAMVWKILTDKHLGQINYVRVLQGTLKADQALVNPRGGKTLKASGLSTIFGKDLKAVESAGPGEVVAITRVEEFAVGDLVLGDGEAGKFPFPLPEPFTGLAVRPSSRADEQKISGELNKVVKEDPTLRIHRSDETHEMVIYGLSELHLDTALNKVRGRGVGLETSIPRIAYQETITAAAEGHHRHKKQTGGAGQFGECYLRIKPLDRGSGFDFVNAVVGGAIPRNFIPAIEKGINEQMSKGILARSRVVDLQVEVYDGKHHDVDSDEVSFKIAGSQALVDAFNKARPILLEPIMEVEITVPNRYFGDVSGDLNTRRGRILGMDAEDDMQTIKANVPLAEMQEYSTPLRSMTHGEGNFIMKFDHYDQVPNHLQDKVIQVMAAAE
ncbi:MAG: elongation factor G [Planctomycetota bacterium]|nr:MAG: elongation factor G [Planctomycetota bacterium]